MSDAVAHQGKKKAPDHIMGIWHGQARTRLYLRAIGICITTAFLWSCGEADSPEAQVRATVDRAEEAIEARDTSDVMDLMSPDIRDHHGRTREDLANWLRGYFLTHPTLHVLTRIERIEFPAPDLARVELTAGVFGPNPGASVDLAPEVYRLRVELQHLDGEWRFSYAERREKH